MTTARFLVAALAATAIGELASLARGEHDVQGLFRKFKAEFGKEYEEAEEELRFGAFAANLEYIKAENAKGHSYILGINEFADVAPEEFSRSHFGFRAPSTPWGNLPWLGTHRRRENVTELPEEVDWRSQAVTPVKNQGQCGSCWAFSTTGALEGALEIATGTLISLSEQQLVDCSGEYGEQGCKGGSMDGGFKYAEDHAVCTEESYPYLGKGGVCRADSCSMGLPKGAVVGYRDVPTNNQEALQDAVAQQPVSVAIEADKVVFQLYKGGVLSGECGEALDHGVLLVGYGTTGGQDYWLVKNSWGPAWGMQGYVMILRGKKGPGECGIKEDASYPVINHAPGPSPGPAPPSPPSPAPPPSSAHYEAPPCHTDEVEAQVQGTDGVVCAPHCDGDMPCPLDVPAGTSARPQCILDDASTGSKYCALTCALFSPGCPEGANCSMLQGFTGICVYPEASERDAWRPSLSLSGSAGFEWTRSPIISV